MSQISLNQTSVINSVKHTRTILLLKIQLKLKFGKIIRKELQKLQNELTKRDNVPLCKHR